MIVQQTLIDQTTITFFVPGVPVPQGSKRAFQHKSTKRIVIVDDNPAQLRDWRNSIVQTARDAMAERPPISFAIVLGAKFVFLRPGSHYGARGGLLPSAPLYKTTRPDLDKLLRGLGDALKSAGVYRDDSQVVGFTEVEKMFGQHPGVHVTIRWDPARRP